MEPDAAAAEGPSAALTPLSRARLDELLQELLERVQEVVDTQDRLRGLLDAVVAIAGDLDLESVLQRIIDVASRLSGARYGALGVLSTGPGKRLRAFVTYGLEPQERAAIGDLPHGRGLLGHIIDAPRPLRLDRIADHPTSSGFPPHHPPMGTFLGVPLRIRDRVFGNLYLTEKQGGGGFTSEDEEIVVALAAAAGVVIENAQLYEETSRRQRWLEAAAEVTDAMLGDGDRRHGLQCLVDRAREVADADAAAVLLPTGDTPGHQQVLALAGSAPADLLGAEFPAESPVVANVLSGGGAVVTDGDGTAEEATGVGPMLLPSGGVGPVLGLPLRTTGGTDGVLLLVWSRERYDRFHGDTRLPLTFAEQAALALGVAEAREAQAKLAVFEDRDRIGRDLHDLVIQRLFAVGLTLQSASQAAERPDVSGRIDQAVDDLDQTIRDVRRTIFSLSAPSADSSFRAAVEAEVAVFIPVLGFGPRVSATGPVDSAVPDQVRGDLLAVVREAMSNVARHAGATAVQVDLVVGGGTELTVRDDGKGFAPGGRESGLRNMRERAQARGGSFDVGPGPDGGTVLRWWVPA